MIRPTKKSNFLPDRRANQKATAFKLGAGKAVNSLVKSLPIFTPAPRDLTAVVGKPTGVGSGTQYSTYQSQGVLARSARTKPRLVIRAPNKTERETAALAKAPAVVTSTSAPTDLRPAKPPVGAAITTNRNFWIVAGAVVVFWAFAGRR